MVQPPANNNAALARAKLSRTQKGGLAAIIGTAAAGLLYVTIPRDEGMVYVGYLDIAGIATKCAGDTRDAVVGKRYTEAECRASLDRALIAHARPVMNCTPGLRKPGMDYQRAAAVSLAYNIGVTNFCRSTVARRFNAGDVRGACDAFMAWNKARVNGVLRPVKGLTERRKRERALCLTGVE